MANTISQIKADRTRLGMERNASIVFTAPETANVADIISGDIIDIQATSLLGATVVDISVASATQLDVTVSAADTVYLKTLSAL